jgi:hypothetical protein
VRSPRSSNAAISTIFFIIQAVRRYVTYKLSYRDVRDLMAERGVTVIHATVLRCVQCFVPVFEKMWKKYARPVRSQKIWLNRCFRRSSLGVGVHSALKLFFAFASILVNGPASKRFR